VIAAMVFQTSCYISACCKAVAESRLHKVASGSQLALHSAIGTAVLLVEMLHCNEVIEYFA
jgi:hypothetical protein